MEPIKIGVKDNFKHTQIAFLVDRSDFIKDVIYLRKKWLKSEKPFLSKSFEEWFNTLKSHNKTRDLLLRDNRKIGEKSLVAKKMISEGRKEEAKKVIDELQILFRELPNLDFKGDLGETLTKYQVPSTCFKAVARAIISNEVSDSDWQFYNLMLKPSGLEQEQIIPSKNNLEPVCEIRITPHMPKTDWDNIYKTNIEKIKDLYRNSPLGYKVYAKDTISNIKRDRDWYWKKTNEKLSYGEILKLASENGERISRQGVIDAIQRYKKNLE